MQLKSILKSIKSAESFVSFVLGVVVVVAVGVVLYNYFSQQTDEAALYPSKTDGDLNTQSPTIYEAKAYVVVAGDTLYKISQKVYGDGDKWVEIAKLNGITNTDQIEVGQTLKVDRLISSVTPVTPSETVINSEKYTVQLGDTLWKISIRAYQDGYQWPKLMKANDLTAPDAIEVGQTLVIPR